MHRLFVYGTLQHPPLLEQLLGRVPDLRPATLTGWRAARLRGRVYPGLLPGAGPATGHVLEVDADELEVLDAFEGPQYERIGVRVSVDGAEVDAAAWRLRDEHAHLAEGSDWDLDAFVTRDASAFLGGSRRGEEHPWGD
ncbi:MAG: gamma-glutamylcyclotransferase family protein [Acidimicrobiia bacterium]